MQISPAPRGGPVREIWWQSSRKIGGFLGIQEKTVKMHRSRLIEALGVKTSADAIRISVEAGVVPSGRD